MPTFTIPFTKMQGLSNDFVVVLTSELHSLPGGDELIESWTSYGPSLAKALCDRHKGVGADGLILVIDPHFCQKSKSMPQEVLSYPGLSQCDIAWIFINSDGSVASICGNALRCVALLARKTKLNSNTNLSIATAVGVIKTHFHSENKISVDLGRPLLKAPKIPCDLPVDMVVKYELALEEYRFPITCVNNGNPHCVIFQSPFMERIREEIQGAKQLIIPESLKSVACRIQSLPIFPQGTNVEFAFVLNRDYVRLLVFERGAGATLACASGAAATIVAGSIEGRLNREATIELPGGRLELSYLKPDNHVVVTGPAQAVFRGEIALTVEKSERAVAGY